MVSVTAVEHLALLALVAQVLVELVEEGAVAAMMLVDVAVLSVVLQGFLVQMIGPAQCKAH